ncbi:PilZ domain-containing protein [Thalassococcus sp. CAU 1522]|uniref:PilZ domain-containing protein n=1 Tax=Thalassococcus arenae TaxID=2851652 RepID=A0ABS6N4V3_9RHOB|nr:PilZ domain-containing protein [Thalassococcus arenae]
MQIRAPRWSSRFALNVRSVFGPRRVTVVNLSANGLRFRGVLARNPMDRVRFRLDDQDISARVVWQEADIGGMQFDRPLSNRTLAKLRETVQEA